MKKVLIIEPGEISPYRFEIFNLLSRECDLTVGYLIPCKLPEKINFKVRKFDYYKLGKLKIIREYKKICANYDIVLVVPHYSNLSFCTLPFFKRKNKVIGWSNGQRANYKVRFDLDRKKKLTDYVTAAILKRCDANVIYVREAIDWLASFGIPKKSIFAAQNTVPVNHMVIEYSQKTSILFVGSLYKKKGLDELIDCYYEAYKSHLSDALPLSIIGKGEEEKRIKEKVKKLGLEHNVTFWGAIYDENELSKHFSTALISVSPKQAGLSVLQSLGYGCPFITRKNAISGGEIVNVKDGETGILYNSTKDLINIFEDVYLHPVKYIEMGVKAKKYYEDYASPRVMVQGFLDAFKYVCS